MIGYTIRYEKLAQTKLLFPIMSFSKIALSRSGGKLVTIYFVSTTWIAVPKVHASALIRVKRQSPSVPPQNSPRQTGLQVSRSDRMRADVGCQLSVIGVQLAQVHNRIWEIVDKEQEQQEPQDGPLWDAGVNMLRSLLNVGLPYFFYLLSISIKSLFFG